MLKLSHRLKIGGGGNLLKALITDVFVGGNRLFHCGEIKLSQCHSELVSGVKLDAQQNTLSLRRGIK